MSKRHDAAKLDDLIVTTIDSIRGYEMAVDATHEAAHARFYREMILERRQVVDELQAESHVLGATPNAHGSVAAHIHRRLLDIRTAFGGGEGAILAEIERGEDYLKQEFERAIADDAVSDDVKATIRRCFEEVLQGKARVHAMRKERAHAA